MDQNLTHRNHYIPRFYLKNWSLDGKTIHTYSILVSNSKVPYWTQQSIKNSAVWSDFYTRIEGDKEIDDFEHWFDREFETPAKPVFDKLLNGQKISYEESVVISHYVFAQFVRTPAAYLRLTEQNIKLFPKILEETTAKINREAEKIRKGYPAFQFQKTVRESFFPMKVTVDKEQSLVEIKAVVGRGSYLDNLKHLLSSTLKVAEHHDWRVLHASEDISFPTSDDPVICLNYRNADDYDLKGGWGRKNCNILMPLSPRLILFTQVGAKGPYKDLDHSPYYSKLFRRMIIQHAHRYVYSDRPQKGMLELNARVVNAQLYEREKQEMAGWHIEQIQAERNL